MQAMDMKKASPSMDQWLREAKAHPDSLREGMYLVHNGVVRETPKALVRSGVDDGSSVSGMVFSYNQEKVDLAVADTLKREGIFHARIWLNEGHLEPGDDIMYALVGGDIRPHVIDALQFLVERVKTQCVEEIEEYNR